MARSRDEIIATIRALKPDLDFVTLADELEAALGRPVDLISTRALRPPPPRRQARGDGEDRALCRETGPGRVPCRSEDIRRRRAEPRDPRGGCGSSPDDFKASPPALEWPRMVGLRNRVVHGYFAVELEFVWRIVVSDLPGLVSRLRVLEDSVA